MSAYALIVEPFATLAFMRAALVACVALALANGAVGTLLVLRRMSLDGDVLGHAVMPGAAVGFLYAGPSPTWLSLGGLASGFAVAALAGLITGGRARHDAGLVGFYLVALSLGVVLISRLIFQTGRLGFVNPRRGPLHRSRGRPRSLSACRRRGGAPAPRRRRIARPSAPIPATTNRAPR